VVYSVTRSGSFERVTARIGELPRGPGRAAALRPNGGHCPSGSLPIGPGDVPKTTVYGHEDLTRPAVGGGRPRAVPADREVQVTGLTQTELEGRLCQLLGKDS
jgi:hypothetical protein